MNGGGTGGDCPAGSGESLDILLAGVGGQGILLISRVLGEAAIRSGVHFVMSEVHGMAQRGGVVTSHIRLGEVHGPLISRGTADVLVALEPVESLRAIEMAGAGTTVISTTRRVIPFTVAVGGDEYPPWRRCGPGWSPGWADSSASTRVLWPPTPVPQ
jgi:indolepyruvate ferredoxin oxidoreductase beta subunit